MPHSKSQKCIFFCHSEITTFTLSRKCAFFSKNALKSENSPSYLVFMYWLHSKHEQFKCGAVGDYALLSLLFVSISIISHVTWDHITIFCLPGNYFFFTAFILSYHISSGVFFIIDFSLFPLSFCYFVHYTKDFVSMVHVVGGRQRAILVAFEIEGRKKACSCSRRSIKSILSRSTVTLVFFQRSYHVAD